MTLSLPERLLLKARRHLWPLLTLLIYVIVSHWQLVTNIRRAFFGRPFEDAIAVIWEFWLGLQILLGNTGSILFTPDVYFPHGYYLAADAQPIWWMILLSPLTYLTDPLLAFNLSILITLLVAAVGMYLLVEQLTQNRWAGVLSGIIYITAPLISVRMAGQLNLLLGLAWLPLMTLFFYRALSALGGKSGILYGILAGIFLGLATLSSYYFVFIGLLLIISLFLYPPTKIEFKEKSKRVGLVIGCWLIVSLPFVLLTHNANQAMYGETLQFSLADTDNMSISLHRLLVPNPLNPLWRQWVSETFPLGSEETLISLDYVAILLAFLGFWKGPRQGRNAFGFLILLSLVLAMGMTLHWADERVIVHLPGVLGGWYQNLMGWLTNEITMDPAIPMPGLILAKVVPFYAGMRAWPRFLFTGILGLAVLAGYGVSYIMSSYKRGWLLAILAFIAVSVSGLMIPYTNFTEVAQLQRPVDDWLAQHEPGAALIEYPWSYRTKLSLYSQTLHGQPIVNGYAPHLPKFLKENPAVTQMWPDQVAVNTLQRWGVQYILVSGPADQEFNDTVLAGIAALSNLCFQASFPAGAQPDSGHTHLFEILRVGERCRLQ